MTENKWAHIESATQIIIGSLLAQAILFAFGVQFVAALKLNIAMLSVSYARQYAIRRLFARLRYRMDIDVQPLSKDELKKIFIRNIYTPHGSL